MVQRRAKTIINHHHHHIFCTLTIVHINSKAICRSRVRLYFEVNSDPHCLDYCHCVEFLEQEMQPKKGHMLYLFLLWQQKKLPLDIVGAVNMFCCISSSVEQQQYRHPVGCSSVWGKSCHQSLGQSDGQSESCQLSA